MVLAFVQAVIVLGVSFGLALTPEQTAAILALTAVVLGLITRAKVVPNGSVAAVAAAAPDAALAAPYIPGQDN